MQTRSKVVGRNAVREHVTPRFCRHQKKMTVAAEGKVTELITSSAKKQKPAGILSKKNKDAESEKNMSASYFLAREEGQTFCVAYGPSIDHKLSDATDSRCALDTIFSPTFHIPKDVCGGIPDKVHFMDFFRGEDQTDHQDHVDEVKVDILNCHVTSEEPHNNSMASKTEEPSPCVEEYKVVGNLYHEVSAIYLAMRHSKLECVEEPTHDQVSTEGCLETDEVEDFDDFNPYLFIKNLPDLPTVVPTFRPMLLPKQTRSCPSTSLVLDLDETLVHSSFDPCEDADFTFLVNCNLKEHTIYVRCRPHLKDFLERVSSLFEIIIFTASQSIYAEQLLNVLDPKRRLFRHRVYRESCVFVEGNYLKDLSVLGRDLARVIIVDNSPQAFGFQVDNGVPIESWFDDCSDTALLSLLPFLESLIGVEDVRPLIAKKFNLREKIAAAAHPSIGFTN